MQVTAPIDEVPQAPPAETKGPHGRSTLAACFWPSCLPACCRIFALRKMLPGGSRPARGSGSRSA